VGKIIYYFNDIQSKFQVRLPMVRSLVKRQRLAPALVLLFFIDNDLLETSNELKKRILDCIFL
jgi:hypothetical protein